MFAQQDLTRYVNPFIGTAGHGHTFPGAIVPFGMVQLSPDTRLTGWDGCSGYHYSDSIIYGFSHTHLSGTGISDYGDILLMPTVGESFNALNDWTRKLRVRFNIGMKPPRPVITRSNSMTRHSRRTHRHSPRGNASLHFPAN